MTRGGAVRVPLLDLQAQYRGIKAEIDAAVLEVLDSQQFILGPHVTALEEAVARYSGCAHGIGVSSGTDALLACLMAEGIGPGDEVITSAYSFFASAGAVARVGARPVFVDIDPASFNLEPGMLAAALTRRTRAIIPVHLFGQMAPMKDVLSLSEAHGLTVIEDAAQAIGAALHGRAIGGGGDAACLSFYPTKNLGACGDAGMVVTNRADVAERLRRLRHHGDGGRYRHVELGYCSRLDEMQAALLRIKLRRLDGWTVARRRIAARYREALAGLPVRLPVEPAGARHIYHLFTVRHPQRDAFVKALDGLGVGTAVHYPLPVPGQPMFGGGGEKEFPHAWRAAREVVSLPCFPELTDAEVSEVIAAVKDACARA